MSALTKILTCVLGALAVLACLATIGIIGYAVFGPRDGAAQVAWPQQAISQDQEEPAPTLVPTAPPEGAEINPDSENQIIDLADHVHDYKESVVKKATCFSAGQLMYACSCGDVYYVDIMSTGHVAGEWQLVKKAAQDVPGLRVQKCIYCDDIMAQETVYYTVPTGSSGNNSSNDSTDGDAQSTPQPEPTPHIHQYMASIEREPSCILAGLRMYKCSCGDFYTENIPADGHVASDWRVVEEPTTTYMGTEQRICQVCSAVLDSRRVNMLTASPAASGSGNAQASGSNNAQATSGSNSQATAKPSTAASSSSGSGSSSSSPGTSPGNATPSATPHQHNYVSYVIKPANCTEQGIMSYICECGSSDSDVIERDLNNHSYRSTVIPATSFSPGYTIFTCIRCNYQYFDNYTPF